MDTEQRPGGDLCPSTVRDAALLSRKSVRRLTLKTVLEGLLCKTLCRTSDPGGRNAVSTLRTEHAWARLTVIPRMCASHKRVIRRVSLVVGDDHHSSVFQTPGVVSARASCSWWTRRRLTYLGTGCTKLEADALVVILIVLERPLILGTDRWFGEKRGADESAEASVDLCEQREMRRWRRASASGMETPLLRINDFCIICGSRDHYRRRPRY